MKILSWNVRGLGRPSKRHLVKDFLSSVKADIVCFQESKLQVIHRSLWNTIGGKYLDSFEFIPTFGSAGGIIMSWDSSKVIGSLIHSGTFSLTLKFTNKFDNITWACTTVYGPNSRSIRNDFWNELRLIHDLWPSTWVLSGDFNTTFSINDKNNGFPNSNDLTSAQNFLNELNLADPPLHGRSFT